MDKVTMIALMAASLYKRPQVFSERDHRAAADEAVERAEEIWTAALEADDLLGQTEENT